MNLAESFDAEVGRLLAVWNALAPPIRPSPQDIEWFALAWKDGEDSRVLIQGATPELVDLVLRKNASRIIAMDWSRPFFSAMRQLGYEDWTRVEHLLNDWRIFVPELEGNLDVVLGDGSLTMLAFPVEWKQTLMLIRRYLMPGGRIVLRLSFQSEEPFDLKSYMKETLYRFDAGCSTAVPERRFEMLRDVISEIRIAFGLVSAGPAGTVDLHHRADLVRLFHAEFAARYGHWKEWEVARFGMSSEADILKPNKAGRAVPAWKPALDLIEACGFRVLDVKWSGARPAPGVMRLFVAERI